jgi:hypothetical protein
VLSARPVAFCFEAVETTTHSGPSSGKVFEETTRSGHAKERVDPSTERALAMTAKAPVTGIKLLVSTTMSLVMTIKGYIVLDNVPHDAYIGSIRQSTYPGRARRMAQWARQCPFQDEGRAAWFVESG